MWHTIFALILTCTSSTIAIKFKVTREWNYVNFTWPSEEVYRTAVAKGLYIPENNIIAGIKYFEDYFYVTLPRMKNGVPATLTRLSAEMTQDTSPALTPFPSWEMNSLDDCNALQNVQNVEVDTRGQIWIIDGGRTETLSTNPVTRCRPKLIIFDIKRNMATTTYTFPENVANNASFLYDIVVDHTDGGYAYITDNSGRDPGIIVFSVKDHRSWKIRHSQSMKADPVASTFRVNGIMISAPINIASIALGPKIYTSNDRIVINDDREVFFSPLSSLHLYSINTTVLRNEMNAINDGEYQGNVKDYGIKASQSVGMIMDNQGALYYSLLATDSIARWDSHTSFQSGQKIIARDEKFLEWANSFAFDRNGNITILVNKLNKFIYDKLNLSEANFRLITANVGGKSYLYDQDYDYDTYQTSTTEATDEALEPQMLPGTVQDPFMVPNPQPQPKAGMEDTREPTSRLEPKLTPTTDRNHMNQSQSTQKQEESTTGKTQENTSSANKLVITFIGVLFAGILFVI